MTAISRDDVAHLARLARIAMSDEELDYLAGQLDVILGAVARVQEVAADDVPPTSHALPLTNISRPDEPRPSLGADRALAAAPAAEDDRFRVPRILDDEGPAVDRPAPRLCRRPRRAQRGAGGVGGRRRTSASRPHRRCRRTRSCVP